MKEIGRGSTIDENLFVIDTPFVGFSILVIMIHFENFTLCFESF